MGNAGGGKWKAERDVQEKRNRRARRTRTRIRIIVILIRKAGRVMAEVEEEGTKGVAEGVAVLDFDMLCATVALQTQGVSEKRRKGVAEADEEERVEGGEFGGVQRMWEGDVLDCMEDRRIAIEAVW